MFSLKRKSDRLTCRPRHDRKFSLQQEKLDWWPLFAAQHHPWKAERVSGSPCVSHKTQIKEGRITDHKVNQKHTHTQKQDKTWGKMGGRSATPEFSYITFLSIIRILSTHQCVSVYKMKGVKSSKHKVPSEIFAIVNENNKTQTYTHIFLLIYILIYIYYFD